LRSYGARSRDRPEIRRACPALPGRAIEEIVSGQVVETAFGAFETERLYESHRGHGSVDISSLIELPETVLEALSEARFRMRIPSSWAFLDTETTGLAGGTGTYAFLIGVAASMRRSMFANFSCGITAKSAPC
jgi:hypothetical protein